MKKRPFKPRKDSENRPKKTFRKPTESNHQSSDKPKFKSFSKKSFKKSFDQDTSESEKPPFKRFSKSQANTKSFENSKRRQVGSKRPNFVNPDKVSPRVKQKIKEAQSDNPQEVRLNKYIANAGLCSRREADGLIASGMIKVNGNVVTEMGYKVKPGDTVKYGKDILSREKMMYVLLNKPKDFITTMEDPKQRKTVMDLVSSACEERIYPVGRLDRNTTGLLLFTNDGELTEKLTHPSSNLSKIYQAELDKPFSKEDFDKLEEGVELEDGFIKPDELAMVSVDRHVVGIKIHSGANRVVRRIFEHLGYEVTKLDRTTYAGLTKKDLPRGKWRYLNEKEIIRLKYLI